MFFTKLVIFFLSIFLSTNSCHGFFEFAAGIASYAYQKLATCDHCCTDKEIPADFEALRLELQKNVFGQPLVETTLINALKSHWNHKIESDKALTISFHGGPGIGKNYVSTFIQKALYALGMKSPHVHHFNAKLNFPDPKEIKVYQRDLASWISGNVSRCPKQLFIFDEVHFMEPGLLDVIKPFIDYVDFINGVSYKKAIFIFLTNSGSTIINNKVFELWKMGIDRDRMRLDSFEKLLWEDAFNDKGGFQRSENIKSHLIDHYVPFLPLMKPHVRQCIQREYERAGVNNPTERQIKEVMDYVEWDSNSNDLFAKTGCKRVSQKVRSLI